VPEQVALDQMRTSQAAAELEERLGRQPSDMELADHTGLSVRRLTHIRQGQQPVAEGMITRTGPEGAGGYDPAARSLITDDDSGLEFIYGEMDPTNQFIMERSFGMHGNPRMSATEIARELKLTPGAVSHRMQQIQQQLDELEDLGVM
jgi:DNA-directed RNA polymerase specialized sigma subunit